MRLKKLYIYIVKTFLPLLLASFAVTLFIVVMQMLWLYMSDLVGKGVDGIVFLKLLYYASMTAAPLALVLAVLLASLMTYGNLGERLELLAMKAAGIPLVKILKPIFWSVVVLAIGLFIFQNDYMITSQVKFWQYYFSIKNKSPELAIPEGSFYKELSGYSIYVEQKDNKAKMMYDMMIYDLTDGFENATVIVADSGRVYSTVDGKELILELYSGESFQNLKEGGVSYGNALRPYLREKFRTKEVHIPFSADLDMLDEQILSSQFVGKDVVELGHYTDSLQMEIDSIAEVNRAMSLNTPYIRRVVESGRTPTVRTELPYSTTSHAEITSADATEEDVTTEKAPKEIDRRPVNHYQQLSPEAQKDFNIYAKVQGLGLQSKSMLSESLLSTVRSEQNRNYYSVQQQYELFDLHRKNRFEYWRKFTYPVACIVFFLIGAPLGSLIRKGGLGVPFIVAIFFFIIYYMLESMGMKLVREGTWYIWAGMWLPNLVLFPVGLSLIYIATKDTTRLNVDVTTTFFQRFFGTVTVRKLSYKEVAMERPDFQQAREDIAHIERIAAELSRDGNMGYADFFLKDKQYERRQQLNDLVEEVVRNLSNTRDHLLVHQLGGYPFLRDLSRTMRSKNSVVNVILMVIFPLGLLIYGIYAARNRRYLKELQKVRETNQVMLREMHRVEGERAK